MKAEDQWFIALVNVWIRDGKNVVTDHAYESISKAAKQSIKPYCNYTLKREERYCIMSSSGIVGHPAIIYENAINGPCPAASRVISSTRRYKNDLDNTYFKYYDDAEEVLENIVNFIGWLRVKFEEPVTRNLTKIKNKYSWMIRTAYDMEEIAKIRASQIGLNVKRRSELKSSTRSFMDSRDLV